MEYWLIPLVLWTSTAVQQEQKPPLHETVIVTAARADQPLHEATALVTVISAERLDEAPALALDERLRQVPGFSLFRRSSSLVAHPTTQGVSLRGIGPSGTSRSLVLFDGLPLNDPFGGWVYWNRLPSLLLDRVEISRGATSQLYGSSALGGTIQLLGLEPDRRRFQFSGQLGNHETYDLEALASGTRGDWSFQGAGRVFDTDGYFVIDESERGEVDRPANVRFQSLWGKVGYKDFSAGVNFYNEERGNGTVLQNNDSHQLLLRADIDRPRWRFHFYGQNGVLESRFSRVLPGRDREFLTADQRFESSALGSSFTFNVVDGLMVGADWRRAWWEDNSQNLVGVFAQDLVSLSPSVDLQLGVRADWWENQEVQASVSPRVGLLYRGTDWMTLRSSLYRGFRAPTLNELYRPFRVGNIVTAANPALGAETLWGVEGGADLHPDSDFLVRINGFWNRLSDAVGNVTVGMEENLILRQRQNIEGARIAGLELEGQRRLTGLWFVQAGYLLSDAVVRNTGLRLPQTARHEGSAALSYRGRWGVTLQGRWSTAQFEDDLNELPLAGFAVFDVFVRRALNERLEAFVALENAFDRSYPVGRTPIEVLGAPRLVHGGVRVRIQ